MNHVSRVLVLATALVLALAACAPTDLGIGPEVTGTVIGYDGPEADVVVYAFTNDPEADGTVVLGTGTVAGEQIRFSLKPAPASALMPAVADDVEASDPEAGIAVAFVVLADGSGEFQLGRYANPDAPQVGDALGFLMYADRQVTFTAIGQHAYEARSGSVTLREGWNVVTQTLAGADELDRPFFELGGGNINSFDWYFREALF